MNFIVLRKILFIGLFFFYLALPTVYIANSLVQTYDDEVTQLFVKEGVSRPYFQNLEKKKNLFQDWMDASLGIRNSIIKNFNYAYWRYLGLSIYPAEVNAGKDGWFFQGKASFEQYTGKRLFSPRELENWIEVMEARQKWLAGQGIHFYIIFAPTKYFVYPEKLAFWVRKAQYTSVDQLFDRLGKSTLHYYDGLEAVLDKKNEHRVYTTADIIHWTDSGAWFVFEEAAKEIKKFFPESLTWPDILHSGYRKYVIGKNFCGMARKLLKFDDMVPCPWETPVLEGGNNYEFTGKDAWKFKGRENRDMSIWPNNTTVTVHNLDGNNGVKALVLGHSFVGSISRYFNRMFSEVSYDFVLSLIHI